MADNNQNGQLQLELDPEVAQGVYSNLAMIIHSHSEFVLDFASMMPGLQKAKVKSRVVMAPEHAKRLLAALQENLMRYEQEFGKIEIPNQPPRTATPFGKPKGDA
jgi:hypothetical protein